MHASQAQGSTKRARVKTVTAAAAAAQAFFDEMLVKGHEKMNFKSSVLSPLPAVCLSVPCCCLPLCTLLSASLYPAVCLSVPCCGLPVCTLLRSASLNPAAVCLSEPCGSGLLSVPRCDIPTHLTPRVHI